MYAGTQGGVFLSTNGATNWTALNAGLTNLNVRALCVVNSVVFAGTFGGGVFMLPENGTNWVEANAGLGTEYITALGSFNNYLLAGTYFRGTWKCSLLDLVGVPQADVPPDWIRLQPNPATSEVTVTVTGNPDQKAEYVVLDINGTVIKHQQVPGTTFKIPTDDLPRGVYMLKVYSGNHYQVKRFIRI